MHVFLEFQFPEVKHCKEFAHISLAARIHSQDFGTKKPQTPELVKASSAFALKSIPKQL